MRKNNTLPDAYKLAVCEAAAALKKNDRQTALSKISLAMTLDMDAPEPHNLLGILFEMESNNEAARKHYRAAYALDPTYSPASRNLERLVLFEWEPVRHSFDFGNCLSMAAHAPAEQKDHQYGAYSLYTT